ncbi:MAG: carboxypeptidase-like regulatory domain-containing protein, partial [Bacteroidales bacterium]|nr:carboxypeptidase-like regulatory domain-containing protein [Bacteroidales bacterium]
MLPTKYRRELFILLLTLFCFNNLVAQQRFTISGTIREKLTGETMIGVSVNSLETKERNYTASNEYGFYSLTLPRGSYKIIYSFIGYNSDTLNVNLDSNKKIDVEMSERIF